MLTFHETTEEVMQYTYVLWILM